MGFVVSTECSVLTKSQTNTINIKYKYFNTINSLNKKKKPKLWDS